MTSLVNVKATILTIFSAALACVGFAMPKDPLVGYYRAPAGHGTHMCAEVFRTGTQTQPLYRIKFMPAIMNRCETYAVINSVKPENGELKFDNGTFSGSLSSGGMKVARKHKYGVSKYDLKKVDFVSPTMGAKPPEDAIILFDGKNMDAWEHLDGSKPMWGLEGGEMIVKPRVKNAEGKNSGGTMRTKEKFSGPLRLHLEFNLPPRYGSDAPGARANSGVYFGDFEIQVLEGFGFEGNWGDIGAIYRQIAPHVNACTEPGSWQTFDIIFKPAKIEGGKILLPRFTVWHNGVRIHNESPVRYGTALFPDAGVNYKHSEAPVDIKLQDHGAPIRYRNIWLQKLD